MIRILIKTSPKSTYCYQDKETKTTRALDTTGSRESRYQLRLTFKAPMQYKALQVHVQVHSN